MKYAAYSEYQATGIEWLPQAPTHWQVKGLRHICRFAYGDSLAAENREDGAVAVYGSNGQVGMHDTSNTLAPVIVVGRKGSFGKLNYSHEPVFAIDTTYFIDKRHCSENLDWLAYALQPLKLDEASKDSAVPGLAREDAYKHKLPVPPVDEQQSIARFLDAKTAQIDALVAQKRQLIDKLKEKRQALIARTVTRGLPPEAAKAAGLEPNPEMKDSGVDWLGQIPEHWQLVSLFRVAQSIQTGPFGTQLHHADYVDDEVPLINPIHLVDGKLQPDSKNTVTPETAERLSRYKLTSGEIVFARRGDIGRCGVVLPEQAGWLCGTGSMVVRLHAQYCDSHYYTLVFQSSGFRSLLELNAVGTTMLNLNPSILGRMMVPVPPLIEQQSIVVFIGNETAKIDSLIQQVESAITRLTEYRQALITSAVTGKIDVRELAQ